MVAFEQFAKVDATKIVLGVQARQHLLHQQREPLLRRDWEIIARRARDLGFQVTLLTNGSLVDERVADILAELERNREALRRYRANWGFFRDRRPDLYGRLTEDEPVD